jgi:hypothetical protein
VVDGKGINNTTTSDDIDRLLLTQDDVDPSALTRISIDLQQTMCLGRPSLPTVASLGLTFYPFLGQIAFYIKFHLSLDYWIGLASCALPTCISYRIVVLSSLSPTRNSIVRKLVDFFKEILPMVFSGIRAFLLNQLKVDDMNHVLSELVLQEFVCCIVTCSIAPYHVHHSIMGMHHGININSQVHFNLEQ